MTPVIDYIKSHKEELLRNLLIVGGTVIGTLLVTVAIEDAGSDAFILEGEIVED